MTIIGTGLDATEIDRIGEAIARYGERFVRRVFTEGEIAYCRTKRDFASSFAARFAAKEAAMKALGTGHSQGVFWTGIEVVRHHGPPRLQFHGGAAKRVRRFGATGSLSRSHTPGNWPSPRPAAPGLTPEAQGPRAQSSNLWRIRGRSSGPRDSS